MPGWEREPEASPEARGAPPEPIADPADEEPRPAEKKAPVEPRPDVIVRGGRGGRGRAIPIRVRDGEDEDAYEDEAEDTLPEDETPLDDEVEDEVEETLDAQDRSTALLALDEFEARLAEAGRSLPDGVELVPVYSRTRLVDRVLTTVRTNLLEGALLVVDAGQGVEAQSVANCYTAIEQGLGGHDHPGCAVTALHRGFADKCFLQGMKLGSALESFNRHYGAAISYQQRQCKIRAGRSIAQIASHGCPVSDGRGGVSAGRVRQCPIRA